MGLGEELAGEEPVQTKNTPASICLLLCSGRPGQSGGSKDTGLSCLQQLVWGSARIFPAGRALEDLVRASVMDSEASPCGLCKGKNFLTRMSC